MIDNKEIFSEDGVRILSLFDGMSCGAIAMHNAGLGIKSYDAYEIDKYAIKTSLHNFPDIVQHGDVFQADFTVYDGVDYLIGGSPCFTKGHLVLTSEGYKDISDVQIGDMVLTHKNRYMPVIRTYKRNAETYELAITGFPHFITTENHPFYAVTQDGADDFSEPKWIKVSDMNDSVFCGMHIDVADDFCKEYVSSDDLNDIHISDNIIWKRFKSRQKTGRIEEVYNIEVQEDQSYTVNNCIVHNCTYWSIAQKNNRETEASGMGWELFSQYVRALKEAKPKFFIYENNKSMSAAIRKSITDTFGFEPVCINSALVSAQNRQRLYWVGRRNDDGTYSKVDVEQPEDRGILLKDILDGNFAFRDKRASCEPSGISKGNSLSENEVNYMLRTTKDGRNHFDFGYYQNSGDAKSKCITANVSKGVPYNVVVQQVELGSTPANPLDTGKSRTICSHYHKLESEKWYDRVYNENPNKQQHDYVAEPLSATCEPVNTTADGKAGTLRATYYKDGIRNLVGNDVDRKSCVAESVNTTVRVGSLPRPNGELSESQAFRVYDVCGKSVNITSGGGGAGGKTGLYAIPIEWDDNGEPTKATSYADGKNYTVYKVLGGIIEIKGKSYPIKLPDGYYIIRKLTVSECMRLQTVPEWYDFSVVSNTQAYKMLGNGWTCDVITHLIDSTLI